MNVRYEQDLIKEGDVVLLSTKLEEWANKSPAEWQLVDRSW